MPRLFGEGTEKSTRGACAPQIRTLLIFRVRFSESDFDASFAAYQFSSPHGKKYFLKHAKQTTGIASINRGVLSRFPFFNPPISEQRIIASRLREQMAEVERTRRAAEAQRESLDALLLTALRQTLAAAGVTLRPIGEVLREVTKGVGENWADFPIYGATRAGLALAKEPAGKTPWRYKPVMPGTIFYNPMRILIGSIAMLADDVPPGVTSPDYVAMKTVSGLMEPLWFYEWLRSVLGAQFISTLARGAVRERLLFKRLAQGSVPLPPHDAQLRFCNLAREIRAAQRGIAEQLAAINRLPAAYLRAAFSDAV